MKRLFVIVRADPPPISADLGIREESLAVIEAHLRVLGFELRPTLATKFGFWCHKRWRRDRTEEVHDEQLPKR